MNEAIDDREFRAVGRERRAEANAQTTGDILAQRRVPEEDGLGRELFEDMREGLERGLGTQGLQQGVIGHDDAVGAERDEFLGQRGDLMTQEDGPDRLPEGVGERPGGCE